ncbi:MAG: hypothetical protein HJJLKODD_02967 [Phycisphaerae bacterium]|nr:hypothetical protein [Phycisphaerae bacterium]
MRRLPLWVTSRGVVPLMAFVLVCSWTVVVHAQPPQPATEAEINELLSRSKEKEWGSATLLYVLDEADVYVQSSGLATTKSCQLIRLLTPAAVKSQSVLHFDFDPASNRVTVEQVRVRQADGTIREVALDGLVTGPARQWAIYWRGQQHLLNVPDLQVGDVLEVRTSKVGYNVAYLDEGNEGSAGGKNTPTDGSDLIPPMPGHWYEVAEFQGDQPIWHKRYSVHMPKSMPLQYEVYNGAVRSSVWFQEDELVYSFVADQVPPIAREPYMVATSDVVPKVVLATVPDWPTKSRWFHEANRYQFEVDDTVKKQVEEIIRGLKTDEEKVAALNHWVADNIRYYGTTRGPTEGYTVHTGIETLRDRGGVCKDKAGILVTFLRAAGFEAYPAMTMAGSRIEAIPADQFNHCVTLLKQQDGSFTILDPTWIPFSREMWSSREALQGIVYGTPEGQPLTLTPYYEPDYNLYSATSTSRLGSDGTLQSDVEMLLKGYPCTYFRRSLNKPQSQQRPILESNLNLAPNARLLDYQFTAPTDYSSDTQVQLSVQAEGYAAGSPQRRLFKLPLLNHLLKNILIPDLFYNLSADQRQFDLRLRATRQVRYEDTIQLPSGWQVVQRSDNVQLETPTATLDFSSELTVGQLHYRLELTVKQHQVTARDYPDLKKVLSKLQELAGQWVVIETKL